LHKLKFDPDALKEWRALDGSIKAELKKALTKRLIEPVVESARLHGELSDCFKIKSKGSGYRLVYTVNKKEVTVIVLSVGKRDKVVAYKKASRRKAR
jgi:mRNA interferase RelE/StbE